MFDAELGEENLLPERPSPSNWMVSFGDLLTLLLCFFITIVRFSPLGMKLETEGKQGVESKQPSSAVEKQVSAGGLPAGIRLASHVSGTEGVSLSSQRSRLFLNRSDLTTDNTELSAPLRLKIREFVKSPGFSLKTASIAVCAVGADRETDASAALQSGRALQAEVVSSAPQAVLGWEFGGPECESASSANLNVLVIEMEPLSHGRS